MRTLASSILLPLMFLAPSAALAQGTVTFGGGASAGGEVTTAPAAPPPAAAAPAAPAGEALEPPTDKEKEWAERDRLLNESQTLTGGVGLLRTQHAQSGAPGQFRLAFTTEYFSAGFLCTSDYPCTNPRGPGKITSDSLDHIGGTIGVTASILPWLEGYATTGAFANSDAANRPSLLQVLGDTNFGVKAYGGLSKVFFVGGAMELWLVNGTGSVGLDGSGTSAKFRGLATADLRGMQSHVPLRFSTNLTYSLDNSGDVLISTETARGTSVTRIERFGLNVNRVDHFDIAIGGEYFVADERVRPFIEYTLMAPINRQGYLCKPNNPSGDHCLANDQVAPSKLTLGGRFFPWKHGFGLLAALDIGVTGTGTFIEEVAPTPPWTLFLGASWAIDTWDRPPVERVKTIEKRVEGGPKFHALVHGIVHEKDKEGGIPNAIVVWATHPEWTAMATGPDGKFNSHELADGEYKFAVKADGYKDGECTATIQQQKDANVDCALEANPRNGTIVGHVKDAESNAPVANATVRAAGADGREIRVQTDAQGAFRLDPVSLGSVQVTADADGYMSAVAPTDVKPKQDTTAEIQIQKRPKNPLVQVQGKEITIKQQIQFALDSATILPASNALLTEIADVILKNPQIKKVEIQGHTDNSGTADHNRQLSEDRAAAVRNWLVSHGVSGDRLISKGYGDTKPIAPNVTEAMKARNRRVQFIILEQDKAGAPATPNKPNAPLPVPMPF